MPIIYRQDLKVIARRLRKNMTDAEQALWQKLRRKQLLGIQFYRQRPVLDYVLDFFAPSVKLAIEVDGSQHFEAKNIIADQKREMQLHHHGITVLRFTNLDVLRNVESVVEAIYLHVKKSLDAR